MHVCVSLGFTAFGLEQLVSVNVHVLVLAPVDGHVSGKFVHVHAVVVHAVVVAGVVGVLHVFPTHVSPEQQYAPAIPQSSPSLEHAYW